MPIQVLPEHVIAKIAAGEVVERPASVIKELVENALDAGARTINVETEGGGRRLMRVADDGSGIPAAEVELALTRHATSKLQSAEDLERIHTLGFRGEALASIAAVSRLTLTTRSRDEQAGITVRVHGGELVSSSATGAPAGTVVTVENLFYNVPARLKFLKKESTERGHIEDIVRRYAMAYPAVRFSLRQDGRERFRAGGTGELGDVLVEVMELDDFRQMLAVQPQTARPDLPPIEVSGYISEPTLNHSNRSKITLFVNGRYIKDSRLTYAVTQAYQGLLPNGRFPVAVLLVTLPPAEVDVNVHPTKAEVRFSRPDAVFSAVQRAVRAAITGQRPAEGASPPVPFGLDRDAIWADHPTPQPRRALPDAEQPAFDFPVPQPPAIGAADADAGAPRRRTLPMLRVVGQVGASYIVAEGPAGLYLIDQHAAHTRVLYEGLMADYAAGSVEQQPLEGVTVELSRRGAELVEKHLAYLAALSLVLEPFGGLTYVIRAVPEMLAAVEPAEAVRLLAGDLEASPPPDADALILQVGARLSELAAHKAGRTLSHDEMQALVRALEFCAEPRSAPGGGPTLIHMTSEELKKEFGR
jgi:DNA mismatch repair protein MutL